MKHLIIILLTLAASLRVDAEPLIRVGAVVLKLAYAPSDSPVGLREYVPPDQSVESWARMASVRMYKKEKKAKEFLHRLGEQVMRSHPSAKAMILKHEKSGEYVLDFLTFTPDGSMAEWNLMRAKYDKSRGLVVFQYAARFHTNSDLAPTIVAERKTMLDPFMEATFQEEANQPPQPTPGG